ncbi:MAG: MiaB/RimO family radical SAM methylthiotransferase, partial [Candidatus Omnitrophota bacterium]
MNIGVISLGCPRAVADFESALGRLADAAKEPCRVVTERDQAEILIINTCGFIESAKKESLQAIFEAVALKKAGRVRRLIVMGCLSQRYGLQLQRQIPQIDAILGVDDYDGLAGVIKAVDRGGRILSVRSDPRYLPNSGLRSRVSMGPKHTAYIKISEGCLNRCAYCAIPGIRGRHRFKSETAICRQIRALSSQGGLSEAVLVGQDTAAYGYDRRKRFGLAQLLRRIAATTSVPWIRVLYAHPAHVTDELIDTIAQTSAVCKYLDLPVEHASDAVLAKMNRRLTRAQIEALIVKLRKKIPSIAIRTSVMVGFPSETPGQFADLLSFVKEMRFDRLGVF